MDAWRGATFPAFLEDSFDHVTKICPTEPVEMMWLLQDTLGPRLTSLFLVAGWILHGVVTWLQP